ncbi:MAG: protein-disulfide reductase DsbD domain-containing protein, partial [Chthoniobacterales bacterium]
MKHLVLMAAWAVVAGWPTGVKGQEYEGRTLVEAELIADVSAVVPGEAFRVGLLLTMAPKWHTYWQYSGDAGIPTSIEWTLPEGFGAGPLEWPLPEKFQEAGDIQVYAYGNEVMLISTIQPASELTGDTVTIAGEASWLVCEEICIPGGAEVSLELPVGAEAGAANADLFATWSSRLPSVEAPPFGISWSRDGEELIGRVAVGTEVDKVQFFPLPAAEQMVGHPTVTGGDGEVEIRIKAEGVVRGVLTTVGQEGQRRGWMVASDERAGVSGRSASESPEEPFSLWKALLFGFLGGLILNLMPCVLPVISLKIFGFIQQAGEAPGKIFAHGLAFSAGIFTWFLGLGVVIVAIKASGSDVTWAFQFQNPVFNLVISAIVF